MPSRANNNNKRIAALLGIAHKTVHSHRIHIMQKLGIDMDSMAVDRFMGNAEQGGNPLIIIVGNQQLEDLAGASEQPPRRLRKQLSPRECQILELLIANNNNKRSVI
jgi:DNA-binding NarL/FixJ family response regulator